MHMRPLFCKNLLSAEKRYSTYNLIRHLFFVSSLHFSNFCFVSYQSRFVFCNWKCHVNFVFCTSMVLHKSGKYVPKYVHRFSYHREQSFVVHSKKCPFKFG
jgi:hypothetical protein